MKRLACALWLAAAAASIAWRQDVPRDLDRLATMARLNAPVVRWCRGELRPGRAGGYAVAVASAGGTSHYLVLGLNAPPVELATFTGQPDLACYTPEKARELDRTIRHSETMQGAIAPRWRTTVVCGFLDDTTAACWQYSPEQHGFVRVGGWTT